MREIIDPPAIVLPALDLAQAGAELDDLLARINKGDAIVERFGSMVKDWRVHAGTILQRVRDSIPKAGTKAAEWGKFCEARGISRDTASRYIELAKFTANDPRAKDMTVMDVYRELDIAPEPFAAVTAAKASSGTSNFVAAHTIEDRSKLAPLLSSESACWLTPAVVRDLLLEFAGPQGIALDPCAHPLSIIPAAVRWTGPDHGGVDGLTEDWIAASNGGLIFVNPPYGRAMEAWASKIAEMAQALPEGHPGIIALPAARTGNGWWKTLMSQAAYWLGWEGRLRFLEPTADWLARHPGKTAPAESFPGLMQTESAPFDSALIYFGPRWQRFAEVFGQRGQLYPIQRPGYQPLFLDGPGAELAGLPPRSKEDPADAHATPDRQMPAVRQEAGPPPRAAARPAAADPDAGRRAQGEVPQVRPPQDADGTPWEGPLTDCFLRGHIVVKTNGTPAVLYFVAGAGGGTLYVRDYMHPNRPPRTLPAATAYGPGWLDLIGGAKVRRVTADQAAALAKLDEAGRADALRSMFAAPLPAELARLTQEAPAAEPDPAPAPRLDPDAANDRQRQAERIKELEEAITERLAEAAELRAELARRDREPPAAAQALIDAEKDGYRRGCEETIQTVGTWLDLAPGPGLSERCCSAIEMLRGPQQPEALSSPRPTTKELRAAATERALREAYARGQDELLVTIADWLGHPQDADVTPERDQVEEWIDELTTLADGTEVASAQDAWQRGHDAGWASRVESESAVPVGSCGTCEIREAELQHVLGRQGMPWSKLLLRVRALAQGGREERRAAEQAPPAMATAQATYLGGERVRLTRPLNLGRIWPKGHGAEVRGQRGGEVSILLDNGAGLGVVEVPVDQVEHGGPAEQIAEPLKPDTADGSYPPGWRVLFNGRPAIVLGRSAKPGGDTPIYWLRRPTKKGHDEICAHPLELQPVPGPQDRLAALQEVVDQGWPPAQHAAEVTEGVEAALRELGGVVPAAKGEPAARASQAPRKKGGRRG